MVDLIRIYRLNDSYYVKPALLINTEFLQIDISCREYLCLIIFGYSGNRMHLKVVIPGFYLSKNYEIMVLSYDINFVFPPFPVAGEYFITRIFKLICCQIFSFLTQFM